MLNSTFCMWNWLVFDLWFKWFLSITIIKMFLLCKWVVDNVVSTIHISGLVPPMVLCGSVFGLGALLEHQVICIVYFNIYFVQKCYQINYSSIYEKQTFSETLGKNIYLKLLYITTVKYSWYNDLRCIKGMYGEDL